MKKLYILTTIIAVTAVVAIFGQITLAGLNNPQPNVRRWLATYQGGFALASISSNASVGRAFISEFENVAPAAVTGVCYQYGAAAVGNVVTAIYGPIVKEESIIGAPLLVKSASTAVASTTTGVICNNVATTTLPTGRFYAVYQSDSASNTYMRSVSSFQLDGGDGYVGYFDVAYNTGLPAVATTTVLNASGVPAMKIRLLGY